jgi:hypothetical protein
MLILAFRYFHYERRVQQFRRDYDAELSTGKICERAVRTRLAATRRMTSHSHIMKGAEQNTWGTCYPNPI